MLDISYNFTLFGGFRQRSTCLVDRRFALNIRSDADRYGIPANETLIGDNRPPPIIFGARVFETVIFRARVLYSRG